MAAATAQHPHALPLDARPVLDCDADSPGHEMLPVLAGLNLPRQDGRQHDDDGDEVLHPGEAATSSGLWPLHARPRG
jgi:hypothetical protein